MFTLMMLPHSLLFIHRLMIFFIFLININGRKIGKSEHVFCSLKSSDLRGYSVNEKNYFKVIQQGRYKSNIPNLEQNCSDVIIDVTFAKLTIHYTTVHESIDSSLTEPASDFKLKTLCTC